MWQIPKGIQVVTLNAMTYFVTLWLPIYGQVRVNSLHFDRVRNGMHEQQKRLLRFQIPASSLFLSCSLAKEKNYSQYIQ